MDLKSFGDKVREVRKTRNMTGEALAEKCNMSPSFLRQIEAGKKSVAFSLTLRSADHTLTDEQAVATINKVIKALETLGAVLRS